MVETLLANAMKKHGSRPGLRELFARGGVQDDDYPLIHTAVVHHSLPNELDPAHPHWRLTSLLKDADGPGPGAACDLDPRYLCNPEAREMVDFAEALFVGTDGVVPNGDRHFEDLWPAAIWLSASSR